MKRIPIVALYFVFAFAVLMKFVIIPFGPWWAGAIGALITLVGLVIWKGLPSE